MNIKADKSLHLPKRVSSEVSQGSAKAMSLWQTFQKNSVPDNTFGQGEEAERTLRCARACLMALYAILGLCFTCSMVTMLLGRVEIVDHRMKFAHLESPSIAVCPWLPGMAVQKQHQASYSIFAVKYS